MKFHYEGYKVVFIYCDDYTAPEGYDIINTISIPGSPQTLPKVAITIAKKIYVVPRGADI
jgi:hypothetical protein